MPLKLHRRAGTEGCRTYWLDTNDSNGHSCGFVKLHTSKPDAPRQVDPQLQHLAAMVERAPELAALLERAAAHAQATGGNAAWMDEAAALLSDIASHDPARQGGGHA